MARIADPISQSRTLCPRGSFRDLLLRGGAFKYVIPWLFPVLLFSEGIQAKTALTYKIYGLEGELQKNATLYLDNLPAIKPEQFAAHRQQIKKALQTSLQPFGYYQPTITYQLDPQTNELNITIDRGRPIIITSLNIGLEGAAKSDPAFIEVLKRNPLKVGEVLNDSKYESLKSQLNSLTLSRGYFNAKLEKHQIAVSPEQYTADISLLMRSGRRFQFGPVVYDQSVTPTTRELLDTMIDFHPGENYQAETLSRLNKDFAATGYFQSINIHPLREKSVDGRLPIFVSVTPNNAWELQTAIGFSTDEGPRASLGADKPWLNEKGHSFSSELKIARQVQEISGSYKIPYGNPLRNYYSLDGGLQRKVIEDTESNLLTASVNRWNKRPKNWDQDIFFRVDYETFTQGLQTNSDLLLIPGIALTRRRIVGQPTDPLSGSLYSVKLETSAKAWGSDVNFVRLSARAKWLSTFRDRHRFIYRIEQGALWVDNIVDVPPTIRFFAGGEQTIRGYSYESISPKDASGQLTGGRFLTVGSIEYDYEIFKNWRLAFFVDTGTVTNSYHRDQLDRKTGVGPGIRWISPLGPVKLDVGFAVSEPGSPYQINFAIGSDL